jgi:hypothetical protein
MLNKKRGSAKKKSANKAKVPSAKKAKVASAKEKKREFALFCLGGKLAAEFRLEDESVPAVTGSGRLICALKTANSTIIN